MPSTAVVWFRRDLRLRDHPALWRAVEAFDRVVPLYVIDDTLLHGRWASANRAWFLGGALESLDADIRARGGALTVVAGDPRVAVAAVARAAGAEAILVSREHGPYGRARDQSVEADAATTGIRFLACQGLLVHEPEDVQRDDGASYAVFSPFHRRWQGLPVRAVLDVPAAIPTPAGLPDTGPGRIRDLLGDPTPTADRALLLEPGEAAARWRLDAWARSAALRGYDTGRDRLDIDGTSRLSQDLRWGTLSAVEVLDRCAGPGAGPARFRSELAWRDFYAHLFWNEPRVRRESFRRALDHVAWEADAAVIEAWRDGQTGYPIVDAAMRQLRATGWMHNRARMIVASFLTKHLGVDWRVGEAHFMANLVDGDPASNNGGWQWAASTGTDPQPYFRIFNPTLQGRRHDPDGAYVRRWVPELAGIPGGDIHEPLPGAYLAPIVDHHAARGRALAAYSARTARDPSTARRSPAASRVEPS
ncbi:MAG: deoxyribodipyrimidine photo-lyase [Candidatus Limnocylindrales bacterium]